MKPKRIQLRRTKGWRMPAGTIKCDRSSPWGNQYKVDGSPRRYAPRWEVFLCTDGRFAGPPVGYRNTKREAIAFAVEKHREALLAPEGELMRRRIRAELAGRDLACWCGLDHPCHVDTVLEIANAPVAA